MSWEGVIDSDDWRATLARSWEQIVLTFRELVVVQKRDDEIEPLMTAAGQALIRLQLDLKLEQAKHALLLQRSEIYQSSLAQHRVSPAPTWPIWSTRQPSAQPDLTK